MYPFEQEQDEDTATWSWHTIHPMHFDQSPYQFCEVPLHCRQTNDARCWLHLQNDGQHEQWYSQPLTFVTQNHESIEIQTNPLWVVHIVLPTQFHAAAALPLFGKIVLPHCHPVQM